MGTRCSPNRKGRILGAVPPDKARTVAGNMGAVARELRDDSPGGNREAVSLNRVADTLDDRALIHELAMAADIQTILNGQAGLAASY